MDFNFWGDIKSKLQTIDRKQFIMIIMRGVFLGLTYFTVTKAHDTTFENIMKFTLFYCILSLAAYLVEIEMRVVTGAFVTKAIFTLIDERINK